MAIFEVFPEVVLKDLSNVKISRPVADVTAADMKKMIEVLRNQQG